MGIALDAIKNDNFRIGDLQILAYDRKRVDVFPPDYLGTLYSLTAQSGTLQTTFCGMRDLSYTTIFSYLANLPVAVLVKWISDSQFVEAGYIFPTAVNFAMNGDVPERSVMCGYTTFRTFWGTKELDTLAMLALAYFFVTNRASVLHGLRYAGNDRSAKFLEPFGFVDTGFIPRYMAGGDKLVGAVIASLLIEEFEEKVADRLIQLADDPPPSSPESKLQLNRRQRNPRV